MQPIFYDVIIAAIVVLCALRGKKRGLVLTLCGFLTIFVAFIGASIVSSVLTEPVAALLRPVVEQAVLSALESGVSIDPTDIPLPAVLESLHTTPLFAGLADMFQSALESGAIELAGSAALALAQYAAAQLAHILLFLLSFIAIIVVWWVVSHVLDLAFHLPGLNFLNRVGGLAIGFCQGFALVFILCWLFKDSYITPDAIDGSFLLPYFCGENPLLYISTLNS